MRKSLVSCLLTQVVYTYRKRLALAVYRYGSLADAFALQEKKQFQTIGSLRLSVRPRS